MQNQTFETLGMIVLKWNILCLQEQIRPLSAYGKYIAFEDLCSFLHRKMSFKPDEYLNIALKFRRWCPSWELVNMLEGTLESFNLEVNSRVL